MADAREVVSVLILAQFVVMASFVVVIAPKRAIGVVPVLVLFTAVLLLYWR